MTLRKRISLSFLGITFTLGGCTSIGEVLQFSKDSSRLLAGEADTTFVGRPGAIIGDTFAVVGDINGDGFDDVVMTDSEHMAEGDLHQRGAAHIVYGAAELPLTLELGEPLIELEHAVGPARLTVAPAGDLDGDGLADFVLGKAGDSSCQTPDYGIPGVPGLPEVPEEAKYGAVYVIYGSREPISGTRSITEVAGATIQAPEPCRLWGGAGIGDIDGDGLDDFAVSTMDGDASPQPDAGRSHVFYGNESRMTGAVSLDQAAAVLRADASSSFGFPAAPAGDVNGDGIADWMVGSMGTVSLVLGSATRLSGEVDVATVSIALTGGIGLWLTGAGDLDGDGFDDVLISAPEFGGRNVAYLLYGSNGLASSVDLASAAVLIAGDIESLMKPLAVSPDMNGDGHAEILIGAPEGFDVRGAVLVMHTDGTRLTGNVDLEDEATLFIGEQRVHRTSIEGHEYDELVPDLAGVHVASGDIDGDGLSDFLVGAPSAWRSSPTLSRVYLVRGKLPE